MEGEKCSETFFEVLERQNMQNKIIFELYADDNKSLYPSHPKDILKSGKKKKKKIVKNSTPSKLPQLPILIF